MIDQEQTARLERARSRSVYIGTPVARHPVRQYAMAMVKTFTRFTELGIRGYVQHIVGNSNLPRARNELVAGFLASDFDDLLFIDDDMGWDPNDVVRLLASERDVIGGVGCKKSIKAADDNPEKWCMRILDGAFNQDEMGAIEVEAVGTGFLKISRAVFMRMMMAHPDWKRRGWPSMSADQRAAYYQFFRFNTESELEYGEDVEFCRQWRALGGSIWIDPTIKLEHVGEFVYTGNIEALLEKKAAEEHQCAS